MRDVTQASRALTRAIRKSTDALAQSIDGMVEWVAVSSVSSGAGGAPTASAPDGEELQVLEPYGFAGRPPGSATTLAVSYGGEATDRIALGVSDMAGRPATDAGDAAIWTAAGHSIALDDDGGLLVTGKDGSSVDLDATGAITITAGTGASITINVDAGASVNVGGAGALSLLKAAATEAHLAAAAAFVALPGNFIPNDGGVKAFASFLAYLTGAPPAPPVSLTDAAETTKAKGV